MSEKEKPFVKFQGMSERQTPLEIETENLSELIRELVNLIDSNVQINFDHHTTNIRNWQNEK